MILVVLSAFRGRLCSEPMEWPNEAPYIDMPISQQVIMGQYQLGRSADPQAPVLKRGRFTPTGNSVVLSGGRTASVYELTGL